MVVKPIPVHLLPDTVQYEEFQEGDGISSSDGYKAPVTLEHVRVQYLSNIKRNTNSEELLYEAMLFYDVINSDPSGPFEFIQKSKVTFDGKTMIVEKVNPVVAIKLHHYEIGLK
jgi:hypothetical protein